MTMKKLIESIDKLNEAVLPPDHPDWDLTPAERIKKQNERIAADSAADAEVWHKGMKPAETKDTKFAGQGVAEGSLNEVTQGVEHSEWVDNVKDAYHPTQVRIVRKRTEDGRHVKSVAMIGDKLVGQYNMNTGVGTFKSAKQQGVAEGLPQTLRKIVPGYAKREIDRKMDAQKFGRTDVDKDANYYRYKKIQDKLKGQGVAEGVDIVDQDSDLDQQVFTLNVDGKTVSFTYWDYENNFQNPDIKDIYQQAREQLDKKLSPEQIKAVARSVFKSFKSDVAEGWKGKLAGAALGAALISGAGCTSKTSNDEWCQKHAAPSKTEKMFKHTPTGKGITAGRKIGQRIRGCESVEGQTMTEADAGPKASKVGHDTYRVSYNGRSIECSRREVPYYKQELLRMAAPKTKTVKESPQSLRGALNNALSKAEPGGKLDKKIKHHNSMVKQFGKGVLDKAPEGYHMDKKGMIRLGEGKAPQKDTATWLADIKSSDEKTAKIMQSNMDAMKKAAKDKKKKSTNEDKSENRAQWDRIKSRGTVPSIDRERYTDLSHEGLEGPFRMKNGQVLYYDPKQGQYYNRDTDMFVDYDDYAAMNEGQNETVYDNAEVIKHNGRVVGEVYNEGDGWGCLHYKSDYGYDGIDDKEEAINTLFDLHNDYISQRHYAKKRPSPMRENEQVNELSRGKLNDYMAKASDDTQKNELDPSKRPAVKRNKTVGGVKNAFNKLHLQGMVKVPATESAESKSEADKVLKIIEKAKKILAMLNDDSVSEEEKTRLRDKVAGLNDVFEGLRDKIGKLNEVSPVQPIQPVQPTQPSTPAQQQAATGNDQTQLQPGQNNQQNAQVLPPAEQMKGFLQTLKAPGAIDQALRNLKV